MTGSQMLGQSRLAAGLTQDELARPADTSRTGLSAYERGHKSPTLDTVARLLDATGHELDSARQAHFWTCTTRRGRPFVVPDARWRLPPDAALTDRRQRARCYEAVPVEGTSEDVKRVVDGALLIDLWAELVLPSNIRTGLAAAPLPPGTVLMVCTVILDSPVPRYRCGDCGHQ